MSFAINASAISNGIRFTSGRGEETWVSGSPTFAGLDDADRHFLSAWLDCARARGIDAALDLSVRPWGISGAGVIIGVFSEGQDQASWLIVGHGCRWTLARCADGFVSEEITSLPAVLALIDADRAAARPS